MLSASGWFSDFFFRTVMPFNSKSSSRDWNLRTLSRTLEYVSRFRVFTTRVTISMNSFFRPLKEIKNSHSRWKMQTPILFQHTKTKKKCIKKQHYPVETSSCRVVRFTVRLIKIIEYCLPQNFNILYCFIWIKINPV